MAEKSKIKKIVLAYSGGLDTSVILPWLKDKYGCKVVAMAADVGQGAGELDGIEEKAMASGADKCVVVDLKKEFAEQYCFKLLPASAVYEHTYLLGTSIARPLIAKAQVDCARKVKADAVAHGATGKGNDQVRFELTYMALVPDLKVLVPWRDPRWTLTSREAAVEYAEAHGIPITQSKKSIYSRDRNLWHISHEGAELENPANEPRPEVFVLGPAVEKAPDEPEHVEIECAEDGSGFNVSTVAGALVSACQACDQLEPVLQPLSEGDLPITELSRLLTSPLRGRGGKG